MHRPSLKAKLRLGFFVFIGLMIAEVVEYSVGTGMRSGAWPLLAIFAVIAASPILYFFMHIMQLRHPEE